MNLKGLLNEIKEVDKTTYEHSVRCGNYLAVFAKELGMNSIDIQEYREAGYAHDVGKLGVMKYIKSNVNIRELTDEERADYKRALTMHVKYTDPMLKSLSDYKPVYSDAANYHHTYYDAPDKGYSIETVRGEKEQTPKKTAIPKVAQMLAIVDVYDALTDPNRPYRNGAMPDNRVKEIMEENLQNRQYNPELYSVFTQKVLPRIKEMQNNEKLEVKITPADKQAKLNMLGLGSGGRQALRKNEPQQDYSQKCQNLT